MVVPLLAVPAAAACCGAYANDCVHEVNRRITEAEAKRAMDKMIAEEVPIRERTASQEEYETNEELIRLAQARRGGLTISDFNQDEPKTEFRKSVSDDAFGGNNNNHNHNSHRQHAISRSLSPSSGSSSNDSSRFNNNDSNNNNINNNHLERGYAKRKLYKKAGFSRTVRYGGSNDEYDDHSRNESNGDSTKSFAPRTIMALDEVGSIEVAQRFVDTSESQDSLTTAVSAKTSSTTITTTVFDGGLSQSAWVEPPDIRPSITTATESPSSSSVGGYSSSNYKFMCPSSTPRNGGQGSKLNFDGYIDGKFTDGKVFNVNASQETWTLAYSPDGALLAVGLENGYGIAFYETKHYNLIRRISADDTVVEVNWDEHYDTISYSRQDFTGGTRNELERSYLVAAACQNGQIQVHHLKYKVTKKEQTLSNPLSKPTGYSIIALCVAKVSLPSGCRCSLFLPRNSVGGPSSHSHNNNSSSTRALGGETSTTTATKTTAKRKQTVEMAVGEKNGSISIISNIPMSLQQASQQKFHDQPIVRRIGSHRGAAKCLAISRDGRLLASGGEFGTVRIHPIFHLQEESILDGTSSSKPTKKKKKDTSVVEENQLAIQREGAVRSMVFSRNGDMLIAGGYDKSVVVICTKTWKTIRQMRHDGTVNSMAFDSTYRYLAVGSRDKRLTIYDTTTFNAVKEINTHGWVSDLSWGVGKYSKLLAARSGNCSFSIYNIQPIQVIKAGMESRGKGSCLAWSYDGRHMARVSHKSVIIAHALKDFDDVAKVDGKETARAVCFCLAKKWKDLVAVVGDEGHLHVYQLLSSGGEYYLELIYDQYCERDLRAVAWSDDGSLIVCGGKGRRVHFFDVSDKGFRCSKYPPVFLEGIIYSIDFAPLYEDFGLQHEIKKVGLAVGTDDDGGGVVTLFDWNTCQKKLQVTRPRTVRSVKFHTTTPLLAVADSGNSIVYIDLLGEQVLKEFRSRSRVNTIDFSPCGRFIAVADDTSFSLRELMTFKPIQEIPARGSDQSLAFSNLTGLYLALDNNNQDARILQLGPLINPNYIPLDVPLEDLPEWTLKEVAFASVDGPSLLQRYMRSTDEKSTEQTMSILQTYPESIFTVNRITREDCFYSVLQTGKPALMTLVMNLLVTGSLDKDGTQSILTTNIPRLGMNALQEMIKFLPAHNIVEIMKEITFIKVPFTTPRTFLLDDGKECASGNYEDPWEEKHNKKFSKLLHRRGINTNGSRSERKLGQDERPINLRNENVLTPACLPLPGLGSYAFLTMLTTDCPAPVFDNNAMGLVLRIMWNNWIRKYFVMDLIMFCAFYAVWVTFLSYTIPNALGHQATLYILSSLLFAFNFLYTMKEFYQSRWCQDFDYFRNMWNFVDFLSAIFSTLYTATTLASGTGNVYLAVFGTLALTVKLLSYMRGFHDTGWLIAVLRQNFQDVRGFVAVLIIILFGFTVSFRLVLNDVPGQCDIRLAGDIEESSLFSSFTQDCDYPPYGTLAQALFSTFQLALLGEYDTGMFEDSEHRYLASFIFTVAVIVVLVVALNALIALLGDSYSRVQEKATANQRKERAELIVEYLSLLPHWKRDDIESKTLYFHALLEADSRGDLLVKKNDWQGGLNALRKDLNQLQDYAHDKTRQLMNQLRDDIDKEIIAMRNEIRHSIEVLNLEVKRMHKANLQNNAAPTAIVLGGRGVKTAVNAVSALGALGGAAAIGLGTGAAKAVTQVGTGAVQAVTTVGGAVTTVGGNILQNTPGATLLLPVRGVSQDVVADGGAAAASPRVVKSSPNKRKKVSIVPPPPINTNPEGVTNTETISSSPFSPIVVPSRKMEKIKEEE